jgi:hypothetical protein
MIVGRKSNSKLSLERLTAQLSTMRLQPNNVRKGPLAMSLALDATNAKDDHSRTQNAVSDWADSREDAQEGLEALAILRRAGCWKVRDLNHVVRWYLGDDRMREGTCKVMGTAEYGVTVTGSQVTGCRVSSAQSDYH